MVALAEVEPRHSSPLPLAAIPSPASVTWPRPGYGNKAFTGREWDPETGLYYYRARYYDPKIGRFISEDPIGLVGGINLYGYVLNSPNNWRDALGLAPNKGGATGPFRMTRLLMNGASLSQISRMHGGPWDRYFYADKYGWIDIRHFAEAAARVRGGEAACVTRTLGFGNEAVQWLTEWGNDYRSGFSPEDLPSNAAGIDFAESYGPGDGDLSAWLRWQANVGARGPLDPATGYVNLPATDPSLMGGAGRGSNATSSAPSH